MKAKDSKSLTVFRKNLREARKHLGITQGQLSVEAGLHPMAVYMIESGRAAPNFYTLTRILNALGCSFERMMRP